MARSASMRNGGCDDRSDRRLSTGVAAATWPSVRPYDDSHDMQKTAANAFVSGVVPEFGAATYNAGKATIMGFETDATIIPFRGVTLMANYSFSYGKFDQYALTYFSYYNLPVTDCQGKTMSNGATMHLECIPFTSLPMHQASATIRYELPVDDALSKMEASATYSFTDRQNSDATNLPQESPGAWLGAYGLLNANFGWGKKFTVRRLICRSSAPTWLTGRTVLPIVMSGTRSSSRAPSIYGEPRMYGLQLGYHWGQ